MTRPNVLIIGAAKAGTTSLYRYLLGHSEVFLPRQMKEINYFSHASDAVRTEEEYLQLYEGAGSFPVRMDISTSYLYQADAAAGIFELLGNEVKIIVILRNPVDAAHSLWQQLRHFGTDTLSFEEALAAEEQRMNDPAARDVLQDWPANYFYTGRYLYTPQLERYFNQFPRENIALYVFEEFFGDLERSWENLCTFCGMDPSQKPANLGTVHNPSGQGIKSTLLHSALYENLWWKKPFTWAIPASWKPRLRLTLDDLNKTRDSSAGDVIAAATRHQLQQRFSADVRSLEKLLDRSLADVWF